MRISDWSSDVCSSDLIGDDRRVHHGIDVFASAAARRAAQGAVDRRTDLRQVRFVGYDPDSPAESARAEQRSLGSAQHLDPSDIEHLETRDRPPTDKIENRDIDVKHSNRPLPLA